MKTLDVNSFNDLNDQTISRRLLEDNPVVRVVLVSLRAGQGLPQHSSAGLVTVYSLSGLVELREGDECSTLAPGVLARLTPGKPHALNAKEDSRLLVTMVKQSDAASWNALSPAGNEIDLRPTPHERRHGLIFWAFDNLAVGESFILVNDHDPAPLRMQMELMRPHELSWEYLMRGPSEFRIRLSRIAASALPQQTTRLATEAVAS